MSSRKSSKKKSSKKSSKKGGYDFDDITGGSVKKKSSKKGKSVSSKKRSSTPKIRSKYKGGVVNFDTTDFNKLINAGLLTQQQVADIVREDKNNPRDYQMPGWMRDANTQLSNAQAQQAQQARAPQAQPIRQVQTVTLQGPQGPQGPPGKSTTKYVLPISSLLDPYGYSSSYYNPLLRPTYTPPIKNLVMPQYKDRNIENQIHTYREHLNSINAWNNLYFEKMMTYGMSRVPYTTNEETKIHIKNYVTALILYGMNKIISDFELRNLIENGVRDALAYGENIKQGDSPVVIYKPYIDPSAAHPASITPDTEKERRKKKKSKKKKKLQKLKEMELLNEIKELMSQKKTSN